MKVDRMIAKLVNRANTIRRLMAGSRWLEHENRRLLALVNVYHSEREAVRAWLRGEFSFPGEKPAFCAWCGEGFPGGTAAIKDHVDHCPKNRHVKKIAELEDELEGMEAELEFLRRSLADAEGANNAIGM